MTVTIANDRLSASIRSLGAELVGVTDRSGYQYIHQPSPVWIGQAKNLFPNIALVRDGYAYVRNRSCPFVQHGFAKEMEFRLVEQTETSVSFCLGHDERTLAFVPYRFRLYIDFALDGNVLEQSYRVENLDEEEIYFGLGSHTGFALHGSDHRIVFGEDDAPVELLRPSMRFLDGRRQPFPLGPDHSVVLDERLFAEGAHILEGVRSSTLRLLDGPRSVTVSFPGFPYVTLWSEAGCTSFVCIEPWCGLPDFQDTDHVFEHKKGNVRLGPGSLFSVSQRFRFS